MENNGESSQKKTKTQQTPLNFPVLFTKHFDSNNKKGKNKIMEHEKETTHSNIAYQLRQITLNFPSITNHNHKKRSFSDVNTDLPISSDDNNTDVDIDDEESDESNESDEHDDECSDNEYNQFPLNGDPYMCAKERKLRRHKYFLKLINPKQIQCICGKYLKLDKRYSVKNLKM